MICTLEENKTVNFKLTIITVNLNNKKNLIQTFKSVVNQTFSDFEWIIIDGGSTDGSKELIEEYSSYFDYWTSEPDKGIYNAMNKGIQRAHGDYIYFLNSGDTLYNRDTLNLIMTCLKGESIYIGNYKLDNYINKYNLYCYQELICTLLSEGILHQSLIYHKSIFQKYGLYREDLKIISDRFLNIKAIIFGKESIGMIPSIIVNFQKGGISTNFELKNQDKDKLRQEYTTLYDIFYFYSTYYSIFNKIKNKKLFKTIFHVISYFIK